MESSPPPDPAAPSFISKAIWNGGGTWRDILIELLHVAAEVEHDLMVQYLYAAYSVGGEQAQRHPDFARDCRDTMLTAAREEMGHLLTVQNLLLLVGGPVSFERHHHPWSADLEPFEFRLERLSFSSLACYLHAEGPSDFDREGLRDFIGPEEKRRLKPGVGLLYKTLIEIVEDKTRIPDSIFDPASYPYQATWDEFARGYGPRNAKPYALGREVSAEEGDRGRVIVTAMATRSQVLAVLRDIAGQGEGDVQIEEPSHFDRFRKLFLRFLTIRKEDKEWSPSQPVATNPYAGESGYTPANMTAIPSKTAHEWAELFNLRYRMLLSLLTRLFAVPRDDSSLGGGGRAQILSRLFAEMYNMKAVAGILVRLPLDEKKPDGDLAGPPFQMPYTVGQPLSKANFWRMQLDLLAAADELGKSLLATEPGGQPTDGRRYLRLMMEADVDARRWVESLRERSKA
jgi:hypothetical protein